jgi:tryptophanyl-tRNA synthetase
MDAYNVEEKVDYDKLIKEFGASLIGTRLAKRIGHPLVPELFFAHRDLDKIIQKKFAIVSGRGPSMKMHLGHLVLFKFVKFLQDKFGAFVFIPFSDDEKLLARGLPIDHLKKIDYENLLDIIAIGFDPKKTEIALDMVNMKQDVYNLAIEISSHMTASTVRAAMGFTGETNIGLQFYPAMQAAHILYPTKAKGLPVIVPIGVDQDVFVKLTRDVAPKLGLAKPGDILSKFIPGLTGTKMSSSKPETAVFTTDTREEVKNKILNAFTGGRDTAEEHRRLGGKTDVCVVCKYHEVFFQNHGIVRKCRAGEILCGESKKVLFEEVTEMLEKHQKEREKARDKVNKFVPELIQ